MSDKPIRLNMDGESTNLMMDGESTNLNMNRESQNASSYAKLIWKMIRKLKELLLRPKIYIPAIVIFVLLAIVYFAYLAVYKHFEGPVSHGSKN